MFVLKLKFLELLIASFNYILYHDILNILKIKKLFIFYQNGISIVYEKIEFSNNISEKKQNNR